MSLNDKNSEEYQDTTLYDKKWLKLVRYSSVFAYIPFVDFVLAAGSMALGKVKPESDFDVIISVAPGRMFTARFFTIIILDILGLRRKNLDHDSSLAADTLCLNHFISSASYRLSPPHQIYWHELYHNLIPIFGPTDAINTFFKSNDWLDRATTYREDLRHNQKPKVIGVKLVEYILHGSLGNWLEKALKSLQIKRMEKHLIPHAGYKPRIIINDDELELHLDTKRIESYE